MFMDMYIEETILLITTNNNMPTKYIQHLTDTPISPKKYFVVDNAK